MTGSLPETHPTLGTPSKVYPYRDERGDIVAAVYRFETGNSEISGISGKTGFFRFKPEMLSNIGALGTTLARESEPETGNSGNSGFEQPRLVKPVSTGTGMGSNNRSRPVQTGFEGGVSAQTGKTSMKEIRPYCLKAGKWMRPEKPVLYDMEALSVRPSEPVILVEGEKCADALSGVGFLASTSMGGSNAARFTDWTPLAGPAVILWADNDNPGTKYMHTVANLCQQAGAAQVLAVDVSADTLEKAVNTGCDRNRLGCLKPTLTVFPKAGMLPMQ